MLLQAPGQDGDTLTAGRDHDLGRGLQAGVGRFPGIERAAAADLRGLDPGARQRVVAVHQHRPRRLGPHGRVVGQEVDLGVPEDVAQIGVAGQGAGSDRDLLVVGIGGAGQVVAREARRALDVGVALDHDIAGGPAPRPGLLVNGESLAPSERAASGQGRLGPRRGILRGRVRARHADEAVEFGDLAGGRPPVPGPTQRKRTLGGQLGVAQA